MDTVTTKEASERLGIPLRVVQRLCRVYRARIERQDPERVHLELLCSWSGHGARTEYRVLATAFADYAEHVHSGKHPGVRIGTKQTAEHIANRKAARSATKEKNSSI